MSDMHTIADQLERNWAPVVRARELRILSMRRAQDGGWAVNVEVFVRDPQMSIKNVLGEKDVLKRCAYKVELAGSGDLLGFTEVDL